MEALKQWGCVGVCGGTSMASVLARVFFLSIALLDTCVV